MIHSNLLLSEYGDVCTLYSCMQYLVISGNGDVAKSKLERNNVIIVLVYNVCMLLSTSDV